MKNSNPLFFSPSRLSPFTMSEQNRVVGSIPSRYACNDPPVLSQSLPRAAPRIPFTMEALTRHLNGSGTAGFVPNSGRAMLSPIGSRSRTRRVSKPWSRIYPNSKFTPIQFQSSCECMAPRLDPSGHRPRRRRKAIALGQGNSERDVSASILSNRQPRVSFHSKSAFQRLRLRGLKYGDEERFPPPLMISNSPPTKSSNPSETH
ncbi:hypothetical protein B0H14DRAFT_2840244 [Mycena olivaceomarginata]|nr:hypothetical protein B0H14DRAFT_2840244 [Mycena olivaceomarginata]